MVDSTVQMDLTRRKFDSGKWESLLYPQKLMSETKELLLKEKCATLKNEENINVCTGCKITVISLKLSLQFELVINYIKLVIEQLCIFAGPYSSECSFVAQNYAAILIDLIENATVPRICQKWRMC
ncbi:unnamed protein product [Heterobilharzia americana]|nr:unnamed protein product [Heterobilharzia americana]CAH8509361.1 unnamed protein product [Heterobilharzia americana]